MYCADRLEQLPWAEKSFLSPPISSDTTRSVQRREDRAHSFVDALARGHKLRRAHNQNTVCMPARSTMITGQYVRTHGVFANGVPLPADAPSVARWLKEKAGYRTALSARRISSRLRLDRSMVREHHGDQGSSDRIAASSIWSSRCMGRWAAGITPRGCAKTIPKRSAGSSRCSSDTAAATLARPEVAYNPIPREHYHTDWVADRTIAYLDSLGAERRLVHVDELPRSASSVGSAGQRDASHQLARSRPAAGSSWLAREDRKDSRAETAPLARMVPGTLWQ